MLLIYTQKVTPRITYVFKHICTNILGISIGFTTKIEEFIAHEGIKISYGKQALGNEIFIQNVELLLEQGLADVEIKMGNWEEIPCFFALSENSSIPYDIFAASFYLLSRYEEYMPHVKDEKGRFPASESLAFQEDFLELPIIDIWAYKFLKILRNKFPDREFSRRSFKTENIVVVTEAFCYKKKGIVRTIIGFLIDVFQFNVKYVIDRIRVMMNFKKDPFNTYSEIIRYLKIYKIDLKFMFQVSDFSTHDRNINHNRTRLHSLIKSVADYAEVGLHLGYYANQEIQVLKSEKLRLEEILKRPLKSSLNNKYNLFLPDTYNNLAELEIKHDFSMGYPNTLGFRAGTCTPFLFYDLNFEVTTPLLLHPYCINLKAMETLKEAEVEKKVGELKKEVQNADGTLVAIFSNEDFSEYTYSKRNFSILKTINEIE